MRQAKCPVQPTERSYCSFVSPAERASAAFEALLRRPFLSPQETADALGIHVNTVLRAIDGGDLRAGTVSKRRRRDGRPAGPYRVLFTDAWAWLYSDVDEGSAPTASVAGGMKRDVPSRHGRRPKRSRLVSASPEAARR